MNANEPGFEGARAPSRRFEGGYPIRYATDVERAARVDAKVASLSVTGFKSIRDKTVLQLRPLTVLAGHNASGKSSFMQAFLLLKQTLEQDRTYEALALDGSHVSFEWFDQLFWQSGRTRDKTFSVGFSAESAYGTRECLLRYAKVGGRIVCDAVSLEDQQGIASVSGKNLLPVSSLIKEYDQCHASGLKYRFGASVLWPPEQEQIQSCWDVANMMEDDPDHRFPGTLGHSDVGFLDLIGQSCFADLGWLSAKNGAPTLVAQPFSPLEDWLRDLIHVTGLRGSASRSYPLQRVGKEYRGVFQDLYASILWEWTRKRMKASTSRLDRYLSLMGLPEHAEGHKVNDASVEVCVSRSTNSSTRKAGLVNLRDTGLGVAQALPWLVALVYADKQPIYIEEPEMHLHPEAQYNTAKVLVDAAMRGNTVIVETHSDILLLGIQEMVAKKALPPDCLGLNWFERDLQGGAHVSVADVSPLGQLGDWPCDLRDIMRIARRSYIDFCVEHSPDDDVSG
jgi:predicted ATPase